MQNIEIIDNFFNKDDFDQLLKLKLDDIPKDNIKVYHSEITKSNVIKKSFINKSLLQALHKNYHKKVFNILKKISPEKAKLYEYSDFSLIKTGRNYSFPIHDDTPNKLLSGVIYLSPKNNTGTIFYANKKGDKKKVIDWRQNRGVFFSRIEQETWHSFEGNGKSDRIALVYNLATTQIKKVFQIENKNFLIGFLRYKINPYLNSKFKKTI